MKATADLAARLDAILTTLREATAAARCTLRIDLPERGIHCNDVAAEAIAAGVKSLRGQTSIDQRAADSIRWLDTHHRPLVQPDLSGSVEPAPPPELMSVFGVTAQMLGPVVRGGMLTGWISVHDEKGARRWTDVDVKALETAIGQVQCELDDTGGARRLAGKVALVTGGNTGIGRAVAMAYADEGADVAIAWITREPDARSLVAEVERRGRAALAVRCDVTSEADVRALVDGVGACFGHLDVLVNNAGIQKAQPITETALDDWEHMMAVHLRGAFLCSREAARVMIPRRSGRIIILSSQLAYIGRPNYTAYSAAKGGLLTFTRALAQELAPHGILVNAVAPGLIDTGFDPLPEATKRAHAASLPLKRLGVPEDLVGAFVFLASDDSRYFCGQTLHPNGGEIMP
jgi:NAD(P)-dependent dehydrogenase (short-subunit alcohol dehydrogenase family)